jgi:hypothetical protein
VGHACEGWLGFVGSRNVVEGSNEEKYGEGAPECVSGGRQWVDQQLVGKENQGQAGRASPEDQVWRRNRRRRNHSTHRFASLSTYHWRIIVAPSGILGLSSARGFCSSGALPLPETAESSFAGLSAASAAIPCAPATVVGLGESCEGTPVAFLWLLASLKNLIYRSTSG